MCTKVTGSSGLPAQAGFELRITCIMAAMHRYVHLPVQQTGVPLTVFEGVLTALYPCGTVYC